MSNEKITSENLEELFDEGCDVTGFFDFDSAVVVEGRTETKRVNVDHAHLDGGGARPRKRRRVGIGRQAVIKMWLAERLDEEARRSALSRAAAGMRGGSAALAFPIRRCASRRALRAL